MKARTPTSHEQFALPFLDTTSLSGGLGLYGGFSAAKRTQPATTAQPDESETDEATAPAAPAVPAHDYRLVGDRKLAESWKGARQTISPRSDSWPRSRPKAATRAPTSRSGWRASPRSALSDLADKLFRRAGDAFAPAWEDLGARTRRARLARGPRQPEAGDPIRPLHAGVHDPRHLARLAQDGFRRRPRPRAGLRNGPVLRPRAGSARRQAGADRRRNGPHDRPDRQTPLPERPHPARGFHEGEDCRDLRPRDRQSAVLGPHRPRRRSARANCACRCTIISSLARSSGCGRAALPLS